MIRNHTVLGLAAAAVIVEAGAEGGTIAAGRVGMELGVPIHVVAVRRESSQLPGDRELLAAGALAIGCDAAGKAIVAPLIAVARDHRRTDRAVAQLDLFR
jgi:predicted Rossmann fold nucleotide-binding protein DprA/Smf involved in DNA uptake